MAAQTEKKTLDQQIVVFKLRNEDFGADITSVLEISKMLDITRIPQAPNFIEGLVNLRGRVIPVIDLAKRFDLAKELQLRKTSRIVLVDTGRETVGLIVDEVPGVLRISESDIEPTPELLQSQVHRDYLRGVAKLEERLILLLDLNRVLANSELDALKDIKTPNASMENN